MKKDIVVFGYYGRGNLGDEKNLEQLAALIKRHCPQTSLTVISADPMGTQTQFAVKAVGKLDFVRIVGILCRSRFLLGGCGNIFQDRTSVRSIWYYSSLVFLAKLTGCRVILYGQGIGPIETRFGKWIAGKALRLADLIIARDRLSVGALWNFNAIRSETHFTVEPLLALPPVPGEKVRDIWADLTEQGTIKIGLVVNHFDQRCWVHLIKSLQSAKKLGIYLIAIDSGGSLWGKIAAGLGTVFIAENRDWERLQCIAGGLDLVVSAKLHGLVAAVNQTVPCYGLAFDPKVEGFCLQLDIPYGRVANGDDLQSQSEKILKFLAQPLEERRRWLSKLDYWKALAHENEYILVDYIKRNS